MKRSRPTGAVPLSPPLSTGLAASGEVASGRGPASSESDPSCRASATASGVAPSVLPPPSASGAPPSVDPSVLPSVPPSAPPSVAGAASQRPIASVIDEQTCWLGQPLPAVPRQPGTQRDAVA